VHLKAVWLVTFSGKLHDVDPIATDEGSDAAPKLEPVTVTISPSNGRGDDKKLMDGES
jgi:hypothetical protein